MESLGPRVKRPVPYAELLTLVREGRGPRAQELVDTLAAAGVDAERFLRDLFPPVRSARPGDVCAECGGRIGVLNTRQNAIGRIRYLGCPKCGWRPEYNKLVERPPPCQTPGTTGATGSVH